MNRIYYPQARASLSLLPYDARGEAVKSELITIDNLRPLEINYISKDSKTADEFTLKLPLQYFAQDPRLFRAVAVDLHVGDAGGAQSALATSRATRLCLGHADEIEKEVGGGEASFVLKGRGYKALLLDQKWQGRRVELGRPLDVILREIIDSIPATAPLGLRLDGIAAAPPVPSGPGKKGAIWRAAPDTPVFQVMYEIALSVGCTVTVEADEVLIRPPRTFYASQTDAPVFITAYNLTKLTIKRNFGVKELPNIRISALDPRTMQTVTAQYPSDFKETKKLTKAKEKVKTTSQTIIHKFVIQHRAPTVEILANIARQVWERFAQQQMTITLETRDMRAPLFNPLLSQQGEGLNNRYLDITQLRSGSSLRVYIAPESREVLELPITVDDKVRRLAAQRIDQRVAEVLARGWRALDTPIFIDEATHNYKVGSGYTFSAAASAYVTVDLDARQV